MTRSWKTQLSEQFAQLLYDGRWFTPNQASVLAAAESLNQVATGEVVIKLYKGNVTVTQSVLLILFTARRLPPSVPIMFMTKSMPQALFASIHCRAVSAR